MKNILGFVSGTAIGVLGGLIGLGGAEFRLPVLVRYFKFTTLQAIIINLIVSLATVVFSLIFRSASIPFTGVGRNFNLILNLLAGSLIGAFAGAGLSTRINSRELDRIVCTFLLLLGIFMIIHALIPFNHLELPASIRIISLFFSGLIIGISAVCWAWQAVN